MVEEPEFEFADEEGSQPLEIEAQSREVISTPYDAPVRTLIDEVQNKELVVNPEFQRGSVWSRKLKSRLVESLILNIPIPVLYFAEDDDGTRVVIDGQQRLRAISEFYAGAFPLSDLQVLSGLNGKSWTDLSPRDARTIRNRTLRCVVISAKSSPTLRFEMFERLNTGFVQLNDQELRNCIFRGPFNGLLEELATSTAWLQAVGRDKAHARLVDHEMALRFIALDAVVSDYRPPLKQILNKFMQDHRRDSGPTMAVHRERFHRALSNTRKVFEGMSFRRTRLEEDNTQVWDRSINRAVYDIQMLAFADLQENELQGREHEIREVFEQLCLYDADFSDAISRATADRTRFYRRLRKWADALGAIRIEASYAARLPEESP